MGLLLATGSVLARFGVVLGVPWYGALSGRLEALRAGVAPAGSGGLGGALRDLGRAVRYEVRKLLLVLTTSALLLPVNLVPGVGAAAVALGAIALGATVACLDPWTHRWSDETRPSARSSRAKAELARRISVIIEKRT